VELNFTFTLLILRPNRIAESLITMRRASIVLASALTFACLMLLASASAAAKAPQGVLLDSSQSIEAQVNATKSRHVIHTLAGLRFGPGAIVISPEELDSLLGPNLTETPASPDNELDEVEVEARAPRGVHEEALQSQIPFGLPALAWGVEHPGEAWRLLLPILS
jgi:hypothetical protein